MQWELQYFMPASYGMTALFLQKMPSAAELPSAVPYLQERRSRKKLGSPVSSSVGAGVKHSPLAFRPILVENKRERVLCRSRVMTMPMCLSFCYRRLSWQSGWPSDYITAFPSTWGQMTTGWCCLQTQSRKFWFRQKIDRYEHTHTHVLWISDKKDSAWE